MPPGEFHRNRITARFVIHCNNLAFSTKNVAEGFKYMLICGLPLIDSSSVTIFPNVYDWEPEPPFNTRHVVLVPQVVPLPV